MTDFWTFENSLVLMILMVVIGLILSLMFLPQIDILIHVLRGIGFDAGAGTKWDTTRLFWQSHTMLVALCYVLPIFGVGQFILVCTRRGRRDTSEGFESGAIYYDEE